ncbi:MAG: hypothetical protein HQM14_21760 [SAR324 cluster bacterium]|nr:hypothetical protein [SAR324 cluster bacterium]
MNHNCIEEFVHFKNDPDDPNSLSRNQIKLMDADPTGTLWIGTEGGGVNRFDPNTEQFTRYRAEKDDDGEEESKDDKTEENLKGEEEKYRPGQTANEDTKVKEDEHNRLSSNKILSILEDHAGTLWVGTGAGLNQWIQDKESFKN